MSQVRFEPTIPVFEKAQIFHALYSAATLKILILEWKLRTCFMINKEQLIYYEYFENSRSLQETLSWGDQDGRTYPIHGLSRR
jgi:hypothetical protein